MGHEEMKDERRSVLIRRLTGCHAMVGSHGRCRARGGLDKNKYVKNGTARVSPRSFSVLRSCLFTSTNGVALN